MIYYFNPGFIFYFSQLLYIHCQWIFYWMHFLDYLLWKIYNVDEFDLLFLHNHVGVGLEHNVIPRCPIGVIDNLCLLLTEILIWMILDFIHSSVLRLDKQRVANWWRSIDSVFSLLTVCWFYKGFLFQIQ